MKEKSIKANVVLNIIRLASTILLPMVSYPYISRVLGPQQLGKVDFSVSIINYFSIIACLGIPSYGIICCSKVRGNNSKLKKTVIELLVINFLLTLLAYVALLFCIIFVPAFGMRKKEILIYSITILGTTLGVEWLYAALEDFKYITIRSIIFKVASVITMILLVKNQNDYIIYEGILVISTIGSNMLNFIHAKKIIDFSEMKNLQLKRHILPIVMFASSSIAATINSNTDTAMLGILKNDYEVGIYSFSIKFKSILVTINNAALTVMIPRLSFFAGKNDMYNFHNLLKKATDSVMTIACGIPIFFCIFATETAQIIGGNSYMMACPTMIVLNVCVIVLGITWIVGVGVLQTLGRQKLYAKTMWMAVFINITLNLILIPKLGAFGAAFATLITEIFNAIMFYIYSIDILKNQICWITYVKLLFGAMFIGVFVKYIFNFLDFNYGFKIIVAGSIFGIGYGVLAILLLKNIRDIFSQILKFIIGFFK